MGSPGKHLYCGQSSIFPPWASLLLPVAKGFFTHRDTHVNGLLPCHQLADGFIRLLFALVLKSLGGQLLQRLLELLVVDDAGCLPSASTKPRLPSARLQVVPPNGVAAGWGASGRPWLCPPAASGPSPTSKMQLQRGKSQPNGSGWIQLVLSSRSFSATCC